MIVIVNGLGTIALLLYAKYLLIKPKYAVFLALGMLICDFGLSEYVNFPFINKAMILLAVIVSILKYSMKRITKMPLILLGLLFATNFLVMLLHRTPTYSFTEFITAFATLSIGFLLFYIKWNEKDVIIGLRVLSYLAIVNVAIGIIMKGYIFSNDWIIVSGGMTQHLVFYSSIGMYASAILANFLGQPKSRKFIIINLLITFLSQMRGGTIFALILFVPIIIPYMKKMKKKQFAILLSPAVVYIAYLMINKMISRTLETGIDYGSSFLNTSSRFYVWQEMLEFSEGNRVFGLGIGYIKTLNEFFTRLGFISPHNEYIKFLVEGGFVGLCLLIVCFWIIFRVLYKHNCFGKERRGLIIALILGFAFYSITDNTISAIEFWGPFNLCISLLYKAKEEETKCRASPSLPLPIGSALQGRRMSIW